MNGGLFKEEHMKAYDPNAGIDEAYASVFQTKSEEIHVENAPVQEVSRYAERLATETEEEAAIRRYHEAAMKLAEAKKERDARYEQARVVLLRRYTKITPSMIDETDDGDTSAPAEMPEPVTARRAYALRGR